MSNDYKVLRNQFSKFHRTPSYEVVDEKAYFQDIVLQSNNLLSCNKDLFFNHLNYYLLRQLDLIKQFSVEKSTSDFFNKAKIVLQNSEKVNFYSNNIFNRIKILLSDDKSIKLVPSLVEPWPQVDDSGLIFTDLSPVEFQLAPYIHDFCYMIFKYDYYGSRNTDHKFILTIILDALEKVINKKENEIFNMHLEI